MCFGARGIRIHKRTQAVDDDDEKTKQTLLNVDVNGCGGGFNEQQSRRVSVGTRPQMGYGTQQLDSQPALSLSPIT